MLLAMLSGPACPAGEAQAAPAAGAPAAQAGDEAAARELFGLCWLSDCDPREFRRPGRWEVLGKVRAAFDAGDFAGAMEQFKRHQLERLRLCDGFAGWGVAPGRLDPWSVGEPGWAWVHPMISTENEAELRHRADDLRQGFITEGNQRIAIGKPGTVDWATASAAAKRDGRGQWPFRVEAFNPLLAAYALSGERAWLDTWAGYADDWASHQHDGLAASPIDMPDGWNNGAESAFDVFRLLRAVAMVPGGIDAVPAATFARVTARLVRDYLPLSYMYYRCSGTNWTDVAVAPLVDAAFLFDEFRCAPLLLREALRRLELLVPTRQMPDGVDLDVTAGYGFHFLTGAAGTMARLAARRSAIPEWMLPEWERTWRAAFPYERWCGGLRERMHDRARFLLALQTAQGEMPIGGSRTGHNNWSRHAAETISALMPEATTDPDLVALMGLAAGPLTRPPSFQSDCFPVSGFFYQRLGWRPGDPYLAMHCSPHPTGGDLSDRDNNAIGLSAWGADLLDTGEDGAYDQPRSPLRVDGQEQHFRDGYVGWDHRAIIGHDGGLVAWNDPAPWRWHASLRYDLSEGIYAGPYAGGIAGVTHQRLVLAVRAAGLWIVIDRVRAAAPHAYTLDWWLPIATGRDQVFTLEQIAIDEKQGSIITARPTGPNVSLRHFTGQPLAWDRAERHGDPKNGYHTHDMLRLGATWRADAPSVVVTAILARPEHGADLSEVRTVNGAGAVGFTARTAGGLTISFQAASGAPVVLTAGAAGATGEALLLVEGPGAERSGIALGASAFTLGGKRQELGGADAEFALVGGALTTVPIRTPVENVRIGPADRDGFVGTQAVTLTCATPDVDIHYTIDGGEPGLLAPIYHEPLQLRGDATVEARAIRRGTTRLPTDLGCRVASLVARADFHALAPLPAKDAKTAPGLRYERFLGRWQDLLLVPALGPPAASGRSARLFAPESLAPGTVSAVRYRGFLKAPADGLYVFSAPPEYWRQNILAAYELRVVVDGQTWYPATTRHALGTWSVALTAGLHRFEVFYGDFRGDIGERRKGQGVWMGAAPLLELSGPGIPRGEIAAELLSAEP
ncbi:MAG: chitobiase/beta-hexosaminidase C-terminal domain-containing protein [Planctomycetes bacterium]|nr:chitobiase/beta-hexosaminidase C-terminal domain-containing protein [Planctomycetota bacterium]